MRRPLAVAGFSVFLCLYLIMLCTWLAPLLLGIAAVCLALLLLLRKRVALWNTVCVCAAVVVICAVFLTLQAVRTQQNRYYTGGEVSVTARCDDLPQRQGNLYVYMLRTRQIDGKPVHLKLRALSHEELDISLYDTVQASVTVQAADVFGKAKAGDQAKGLLYEAWLPDTVQITPDASGFSPRKSMLLLRQKLTDAVRQNVSSDASGVLAAMLTGDKSGVNTQVKSDFSKVGLSHLMAVSGLHLSIWAMSVFFILSRTRIGRRAGAAVAMVFVAGFMTLTGFTPSIQRAGIMMMLYLGAFLFRREADAYNSLGGAVLLILLCNPYSAGDMGLQLSFLSTLGILIAVPRAAAWYETYLIRISSTPLRHACKAVFGVVCITLCATAATLPVNLIEFGGIALIAPLANLLVTNAAALSMILCGLAVLAGFAGPGVQHLLFVLSGGMGNYVVRVTHALAGIPYSYISVQGRYAAVWLAGTCVLFGVAFLLYRHRDGLRRGLRITALVSAAALLCSIAAPAVVNGGMVSVYIARGRLPCVVVTQGTNACIVGAGERGRGVELARQANAYLPDCLYLWAEDNLYDTVSLQEYCAPRELLYQGMSSGSRVLCNGVQAELRPQGVSLAVNGVTCYISTDGAGYGGEQLVVAGRADPAQSYGDVRVIETDGAAKAKHVPNALTMAHCRVIILTISASGAVHIREG